MVRLLILHGPPAVGKYTVARELAARTAFDLFHNHDVVDEVLREHAFGTPGFVRERDRRWREHLAAAAASGSAGVIFTFNPENSVPQEFIDWLFGELAGRLTLRSVGLTASEASIEARLDLPERRQFRKLVDRDLYRRLRADGTFARPVIPRTDLWLDTQALTPSAAADRIVEHFALPRHAA